MVIAEQMKAKDKWLLLPGGGEVLAAFSVACAKVSSD
jgi:hypothetical protein